MTLEYIQQQKTYFKKLHKTKKEEYEEILKEPLRIKNEAFKQFNKFVKLEKEFKKQPKPPINVEKNREFFLKEIDIYELKETITILMNKQLDYAWWLKELDIQKTKKLLELSAENIYQLLVKANKHHKSSTTQLKKAIKQKNQYFFRSFLLNTLDLIKIAKCKDCKKEFKERYMEEGRCRICYEENKKIKRQKEYDDFQFKGFVRSCVECGAEFSVIVENSSKIHCSSSCVDKHLERQEQEKKEQRRNML